MGIPEIPFLQKHLCPTQIFEQPTHTPCPHRSKWVVGSTEHLVHAKIVAYVRVPYWEHTSSGSCPHGTVATVATASSGGDSTMVMFLASAAGPMII